MSVLRILLAAALLCAANNPALSADGTTRFGAIERVANVADDPYDDGLAIGGWQVRGVSGRWEVLRIIDWGAKGDVVLLSYWSGGASCCSTYQIVHVRDDSARATEEFGYQAFDPEGFEVSDAAIGFRLKPSSPPSVAYLRVEYRPGSLKVTEVKEQDRGTASAGGGEDVRRWIGVHPYAVLDDASERARFRQIMAASDLETFRQALSVGSETTSTGRYLLGEGCWPHACSERAGFFAIEIASGRVFAVLVFDGRTRSFGASQADLPRSLLQLVADYKRRVNY